MLLDRKSIKLEAKAITKGAEVSAYTFTLLFFIITLVLTAIPALSGAGDLDFGNSYGYSTDFPIPTLVSLPPVVVLFITLIVDFATAALGYGYYSYSMTVRAGNRAEYSSLFDGFSYIGKLILLEIVRGIFVALWSLLLFVPGIVASYRYRFAAYNLCANPDIGIMEAIRMSKQQTNGLKWQLFVLNLSFIGWFLLSSLTLGILLIWTLPYYTQAQLGYYERAKRISGVSPLSQCDDTPHDGEFRPWEQ